MLQTILMMDLLPKSVSSESERSKTSGTNKICRTPLPEKSDQHQHHQQQKHQQKSDFETFVI